MTTTRTCSRCGATVTEWCQRCVDAFESRTPVAQMTVEERAVELTGWIGPLEIPFDLLHQRIEELVGRSVWTHELGSPEQLVAEIRAERPASMADVFAKLPPERTIVIEVAS